MSFLKFELKSYDEIALWGSRDESFYLHWFGLTDSYYWLDFNGIELLRYNDSFINENINATRLPYVDYQFSRIYEDLIDILYDILEPIPNEVFNLIDKPNGVEHYKEKLNIWLEKVIVDEDKDYDYKYDEIYYPACTWLYNRRLDFGYLVESPDIYFLRNNDDIHIKWYCEKRYSNGYEMWAAKDGCCTMKVDTFINEVFEAFEDFMSSIAKRIYEIENKYPFDGVTIDLNALKKEHISRREDLLARKEIVKKGQHKIGTNWTETIEAIRKLKEMIR